MGGLAVRGPEARELTPEEAEQRTAACFELDQEIKASLRAGREALWLAARALYEFDEASGWSALGYENLREWLADPEVGLTYTTYRRCVSLWREYAVLRKVDVKELASVDMSKADIVLPAVKSGRAKLTEALDDARSMGARDLRETYLKRPDAEGATGGDDEPPAAPVHDGTDTPTRASDGATVDTDGEPEEVVDAEVVEEPEEPAPKPKAKTKTEVADTEAGPSVQAAEPDPDEGGRPSVPRALRAAGLAVQERSRRAMQTALEDLIEAVDPARFAEVTKKAEEALAMPQRNAASVKAVRSALAELLALVKGMEDDG